MSNRKPSKRILLDLRTQKNEDAYVKVADRDYLKYPTATDYICAAIRDFNENRQSINRQEIENLMNSMMDKMLNEKLKLQPIKIINSNRESLEDGIPKNTNTDDD